MAQPTHHHAPLLAFALLLIGSELALAQPQPMTRQEIIDLARPAVGHGYKWGGGSWTTDGTDIGTCTKTRRKGCPSCTFSGSTGADCSGFVAKAWQVPEPNPVELDIHPFGSIAFYNAQTHWTRLPTDLSDVQRGDAFVRWVNNPCTTNPTGGCPTGHIVLVDQRQSDGDFIVYEAKGCDHGIVHGAFTVDSRFRAIRRDDIVEEACASSNCFQGFCNVDNTCTCDVGFAGDRCDRCLPGYTGYPNCLPGDCQGADGEFRCGQTYSFPLGGAENVLESYGCGVGGFSGAEMMFTFTPAGEGIAVVSMDADVDAHMMLLRNECDPSTHCVDDDPSVLSLEYGGDEPYFIVVDTPSPVSGFAEFTVDCETDRGPWIGDACDSDSDCEFSSINAGTGAVNERGFCYRGGEASFCSLKCTGSCPDISGAAKTACTEDPASAGNGICLSQSAPQNHSCQDIQGTQSVQRRRFGKTGERTVCEPTLEGEACVGSISGTIVEHGTEAPIPGAQLILDADAALVSGDDGVYVGGGIACGHHRVTVGADGYLETTLDFDIVENGEVVELVRLQAISEDCEGTVDVSGQVIDGLDERVLQGVPVEVRAGVNNVAGDAVDSGETDENGFYVVEDLPPGNYTLRAALSGYLDARENIAVCGGPELGNQNLSLTPDSDGVLRFVLTWDQPGDLDLHMVLPTGESIFFDAPCRGALAQHPHAQLDVDHYFADGPETITINYMLPGRYELFVHNWDAQNNAAAEGLSESGAELVVYEESGDELRRFAVPSGGVGYFWDVLSVETGLDGSPVIDALSVVHNARPNPYDEYAHLCSEY